jgi:cell division protein FtsB
MRKAGSSMGWRLVLYALSALVVGCTSTPANTVIEPQTNISTSATETSHFYVVAKRPKNGEPHRFYLVKNGSSWILKFSPEDVSNPNTERFLYWPSDRLVTLDFEGKWIGDLEKKFECHSKDQARGSAAGYSICSTSFKKKENDVPSRIYSAIFSVGVSEMEKLAKGTETFRFDIQALQNTLVDQNLEQKYSHFEYHEIYDSTDSRDSLTAFIKRYSDSDQDGLVTRARERLQLIEADEIFLKKIRSELGGINAYIKRYTPARPEKYCASLSKDKEAIGLCRSMVVEKVSELAKRQADRAYRLDVCKKVAISFKQNSAPDFCSRFVASGQCMPKNQIEERVCRLIR